ncbi:MAG: metallophosphoesterase [Chloroflexota bacterium]
MASDPISRRDSPRSCAARWSSSASSPTGGTSACASAARITNPLDNRASARQRSRPSAYRPIGSRARGTDPSLMRIYFCSDLHGSRKCWKKFLNAGNFYEADCIIVGGDITGKFVVPLVEAPKGRRRATFLGIDREVEGEDLARLRTWIEDAGQYWVELTPEEVAYYESDQTRIDALFRTLVLQRVRGWIDEADAKLRTSGVRVMVSGANDDFIEVDEEIARSAVIEDPNGRVVELGDGFSIMGMGWGNPTPWACPRDISEDELAAKIDAVGEGLDDPSRTVFSLHVPPFGTDLDLAPKLDDYLRPRVNASGLEMIPVGSTAVRDAIVRYRPLIGLHGHIHESKGIRKLEGVIIANPGSEYGEGILDGVIVDLDRRKGVTDVRLVAG